LRRKIAITVIVIVCFLLQCTLFQSLSLASATPNLLIIVVSSFGFMRGKKEGLIIGFFSGLLIDIFYGGSILGFYALIYMYIGYGNGMFHKLFYDEDVTLPLGLITGSDLIYNLSIYLFRFFLRNRMNFLYYLIRVMLPEVVYTLIITIFLYRLLRFINTKLEDHEKGSVSKFV
jgi:rod shape-determining protein MreD